MAELQVLNIGGLNLKVNPLLHKPGELLRSLNMETSLVGAKKKRPGFTTFLATTGNKVLDLFSWTKNDGTSTFVYCNSAGTVFYYDAGVGTATDWAVCGAGTVTANEHVSHAVLEDTLFIGQANGTTRHSTNGTSFADTSGAPEAPFLASAYNRIYAGGTASALTWSSSGDGTDWSGVSPSDSSSINIPGAGKCWGAFNCANKINVPKNSGNIHTWDSYNRRQVPTDQGPSSPYSLAEREDLWTYLTRTGIHAYQGNIPQIISNPIERILYNDSGSAVAGTAFDAAPGAMFKYEYFLALGSATEDITGYEYKDAIAHYDYQVDEWGIYRFATFPTTFGTYTDNNGNDQVIFGDSAGKTYTYGGTALSDNGTAIQGLMEGVINFNDPAQDRVYERISAFANPGCAAAFQVAPTDIFDAEQKNWISAGDLSTGVVNLELPSQTNGKMLFWQVADYSSGSRFEFYGFTVKGQGVGS